MGMFDDFYEPTGEYHQLKCWERVMHTYYVGDEVPELDDLRNYAVRLEGTNKYLIIRDCKIIEASVHLPADLPSYNKWGQFGNPL